MHQVKNELVPEYEQTPYCIQRVPQASMLNDGTTLAMCKSSDWEHGQLTPQTISQ